MTAETVETPARGVRARVREEMRAEILAAARRHLADEGPAGLSFRAVARDVGLVSSAVYRYFPSRDALLTALIVESYDELGETAERAEATVPRDRFADRYRAVARAVREWAVGEPHQWTLIYGSPIPGYAAPQDTVGPAVRVPLVLAGLLGDAWAAGAIVTRRPVPDDLHAALELRSAFPRDIPDDLLVAGLVAWTYILGSVMMQVNGQRHRVVADDAFAAVYDVEIDRILDLVGLADPSGR